MTKYSVTCVIEGENDITKEVEAESPKEAINKVAVKDEEMDVFLFEDDYIIEFVKTSKIIKFIVVDSEKKAAAVKERVHRSKEAWKKLNS